MGRQLTEGSLFAGIEGFALGAEAAGIEHRWSSEIDPFAVSVSKRHFPNATHLGDITNMNGREIEPVDVITFGSPCQDLSVANTNRDGLEGSRSSLFFEAVRVIREMREATNGRYPRIGVWENVRGAFSSNGGEDFRRVIEALAQLNDISVSISRPKRWTNAGLVVGLGWSIAWRVLDAQYFGVAQRRRRVIVVIDFGGERAANILFEREGEIGHSSASGREGHRYPGSVAEVTPSAVVKAVHTRDIIESDVSYTLTSSSTGGYSMNRINPVRINDMIRRVTPTECERLHGFPDGWTQHRWEKPRYKALGNSFSPVVSTWLMRRIAAQLQASDADAF